MWIGIYGKSNYGTIEYKWASGEPILYTNWEHGSPSSTLKCVFPFYMTVLGKKTEFNDCTNKGWPGILNFFYVSGLKLSLRSITGRSRK